MLLTLRLVEWEMGSQISDHDTVNQSQSSHGHG
jgi:hypothetical protein